MDNILSAVPTLAYYEKRDKKLHDDENLSGRIALWLSAEKNLQNAIIYKNLATLYALADLYECSITYWYKYLNVAKEKSELTDCYNGLGNGYFMLGNPRVANYYLNKSFVTGGALDPDSLNEEVVDYFINEIDKGDGYKIVYPPEKADYTNLLSNAKDALLTGDIKKALSLYSEVPLGSKFYATARAEMSVAEFLSGNTDKGIELSHQALKGDKDNVFALCNLSSMYFVKEDKQNSRFYYERALSVGSNDPDDMLKIAMSACEQREHRVALKYIDELIKQRPYDVSLKYIYGVAHYNLGNLQVARNAFYDALSLKGRDCVFEYALRLTDMAIERGLDGKLNDMKYFVQLPPAEVELQKNTIKKMTELSQTELDKAVKKKDNLFAIDWAFSYGDPDTQKMSVYILASTRHKWAEKKLYDLLINCTITDYVKRIIITVLVINGCNKRVGMVLGNIYQKTKFSKLSDDVPMAFTYAYAGCTSLLAPIGVEDMSKYKIATEYLSRTLPTNFIETLDGPELSVLITLVAKDKLTSDDETIIKIFNIKKDKFIKLKEKLNEFRTKK